VAERGACPFTDVQRRSGDLLFEQGQAPESIWYVKRGCVVLLRARAGGEARPVAVRRAGSFVGLEALVSGGYLHTARVTSAAILGQGRREAVRAWLAEGAPARMVLEELLRHECHEAAHGPGLEGSAQARTARWILAEARRGSLSQVPRVYAAALLGMSAETLSRTLAELARVGAVRTSRRRLEVGDEALLRRLAGDLVAA
jgi:CRP-like cAMP-binding protein